ncbi:MAG: hypothetical protein AAFR18_12095 [Cyanobacteria bacterium J06627_32]
MSITTPTKTKFWIICREETELTKKLARTIADWKLPGVRARVGHQLSLAVADAIAQADYAIFVTLCDYPCAQLQVTPVSTVQARPLQSPANLLNTLRRRHGRAPQAWWFQLPTTEIRSQGIKHVSAEQTLSQAVRQIEVFVRNYYLQPQALQAASVQKPVADTQLEAPVQVAA